MKAIKLSIAGRSPIELRQESITLGSDPDCTVALEDMPDIRPRHATVRMIDERWVVEVRDADSIFVGGTVSKKAHWLNSGDKFSLIPNGPVITFEVIDVNSVAGEKTKSQNSSPPKTSKQSDVDFAPDSSPSIPAVKQESGPVRTAKKPLSSAIIQTPKKSSPSSFDLDDAPLTLAVPADSGPPKSGSTKSPKSTPSTVVISPKPATSTSIRSKSSTHELPVVNKNGKKPTDTTKSAASKPPKSGYQIPLEDLDEVSKAEPSANVPILKRLSSYEVPVSSLDEDSVSSYDGAPVRRRSAKEEEEIRWIKMVITRSVIAGVIGLIALIAIREAWRAMNSHPVAAPASTSSFQLELINPGKSRSVVSTSLNSNADRRRALSRASDQKKSHQPKSSMNSSDQPDHGIRMALKDSAHSSVYGFQSTLIEREPFKLDQPIKLSGR